MSFGKVENIFSGKSKLFARGVNSAYEKEKEQKVLLTFSGLKARIKLIKNLEKIELYFNFLEKLTNFYL